MVICKYYVSGECNYGNRCRYEHIDPNRRSHVVSEPFISPKTNDALIDRDRYRWVSPMHRQSISDELQHQQHSGSSFSSNVSGAPKSVASSRQMSFSSSITDGSSLLNRIHSDLREWRESAQWPFSSYGIKGFPSVQLAFKDFSPEELRLKAYVARDTNKMADYEIEVKNLINAVRLLWTQILALNPGHADQMIDYLKPYVARPTSPAALASKTNDASNQPSFSFKVDASTLAAIGSNSTKERVLEKRNDTIAKNESKPSFSFKLPTTQQENRNVPQPAKGVATFSFKLPSAEPVLQQSRVENLVYTDIKSLTPQELRAFQSDRFLSYAEIPLRPPSKELC